MAAELNVKPRTLRKWRYLRIIPYEHQHVILFDPDAVFAAIKKYERKPVALTPNRKSTPRIAA